MTSGNDLIANNWKAAECKFYEGGTALAVNVAVASLVTGQFWGTIAASAGGLAFEYAAGLAGCTNNPGQPEQGSGECVQVDGCGAFQIEDAARGWLSAPAAASLGNTSQFRQITSFRYVPERQCSGPGAIWYEVQGINCNGDPDGWVGCFQINPTGNYRILPNAGSQCTGTAPGPLPPGAIGEPTTVVDGDCNWTFTPQDSFIDASGAVRVYYVIEADNDACGGPFAYWSGPSDPTPVNPNPPDCPEGEDCDPIPPEPLPCCDDIKQLLEQIKDCACKDPKPELRGDWRSVHFESDAPSPGGTRPLRKYFRYRSESGSTVAQLGAHWKDFTWQAGSVIVVHKGAWWGQAKVWAASIDEGKRVIRHAAAEAGIDPDQVGEWVVTGSSDPRYGMSGTMRPVLYDGLTWATARTGPSGPPMIETDS